MQSTETLGAGECVTYDGVVSFGTLIELVDDFLVPWRFSRAGWKLTCLHASFRLKAKKLVYIHVQIIRPRINAGFNNRRAVKMEGTNAVDEHLSLSRKAFQFIALQRDSQDA